MKPRFHSVRNLGLWLIPFALALVLLFSGCVQAPAPAAPESVSSELQEVTLAAQETKAQETKVQETKAQETKVQETKAQETKAPETDAQETKAKETKAKETKAQETKAPETEAVETKPDANTLTVEKDGEYNTKDEVALYIHTYGKLPKNYITKDEAQKLGWVNKQGNLWKVAPGKSIGGDRFGNYEGRLPEAKGRKYKECDIDFDGKYRNSKRIIFSNDGLIFYTEDHYNTFEQLY